MVYFEIGEAVQFSTRAISESGSRCAAVKVMSGTRHDGAACRRKTVTRKNPIIVLVTTALCGALALTAVRAHDAPRVATGFVAHILCSETFVSGLDPDQVFSESTAAMPGTGLTAWAMDYKIDRARRDV